jgi:putative transcriptional regulator
MAKVNALVVAPASPADRFRTKANKLERDPDEASLGGSRSGHDGKPPMTEDTEFGRELIASMREAAAILRGEAEPTRVHLAPDTPDVRAIRHRLGVSRPAFAARFGLAIAAVRDREQGLRRPNPAARVLTMVISRRSEVVAETVAEARAA